MNTNGLLTLLWWIWGSLLIVLLVILSNLPLFGADVRAAWEWFVPNLFPTMALVGGIQYQQARNKAEPAAAAVPDSPAIASPAPPARRAMPQSWVAVVLTVLYLMLLSGALIGTLWSPAPLESLRTANLWLGPILALNTASLGVLFAQR
jgi:hypothetical protein